MDTDSLVLPSTHLKWKCMQGPTNLPTSDRECHFSMWVENLLKDVECAFGILKKRFHCIKLPFQWKDMRDCEHVLHASQHVVGPSYALARRLVVGRGVSPILSGPQYPNDVNPRTDLHRATDTTNFFELVRVFGADNEVEVSGGYHEWRQRYIDHYYHTWVHKKTSDSQNYSE